LSYYYGAMSSGDNPGLGTVGAVEAPREHVKAKRKSRYLLPSLAVLGGGVLAFLLLADRCGTAAEVEEVEALTTDAHKFVKLVRSDLPRQWSIEKVLEFAALRPESQAMMSLQHDRGQARVNLESKVDTLMAADKRPDLSGMTAWISKPSWMPRARVHALGAELRKLDVELTALRKRAGLDPKPLPLEGEPVPPVPRRIELPQLPDGVEFGGVRFWPLQPAVVALHWGYSPSTCKDRHVSCRYYEVVWLSWDGAIIGTTSVTPPSSGEARWMYGISPDATFHTVTVEDQQARIERYEPGGEPQVVTAKLDSPEVDIGMTEVGFVVATDPYGEQPKYLVVRPGPQLEPVDDPGARIAFDYESLDRREGSQQGMYTQGGSLQVLRREGVVFSLFTPDGARAPESVSRIADFAPMDEEFLRRMIEGRAGTVLLFEGSMSRMKVLLTVDGGRSWIGAPVP